MLNQYQSIPISNNIKINVRLGKSFKDTYFFQRNPRNGLINSNKIHFNTEI